MSPVVFVSSCKGELPYANKTERKMLEDWLAVIDPKLYLLCNAENVYNHFTEGFLALVDSNEDLTFVAIGKSASRALDGLDIKHFGLPNLDANEPLTIAKLQACSLYIGGKLHANH